MVIFISVVLVVMVLAYILYLVDPFNFFENNYNLQEITTQLLLTLIIIISIVLISLGMAQNKFDKKLQKVKIKYYEIGFNNGAATLYKYKDFIGKQQIFLEEEKQKKIKLIKKGEL